MKLGFNSVLFGGHDVDVAIRYAAVCGYDGIEISAIDGMSQHLTADGWRQQVPRIKELAQRHQVQLLAIEQPDRSDARMLPIMQAAVELGVPVINCGPGGKSNDESTFQQVVDDLGRVGDHARTYGLSVCFKAHVGQYVYNTPTTLKVIEKLNHPAIGLDMDPSHVHRAGENPVEALAGVVKWMRHVHIRDCHGRQQGPGKPEMQANGRGEIDLLGFMRVLHEARYQGPVDLEIIGARDYDVAACVAIAAESRGHMQACLQACGAR